ncbi:hypothetical protein C8Q80DRAFT_1122586 [Daedaleopsis nitida]|nr:hypothetical protein C8Q80DRAFT_1122586 [Daedaleopsis nitida]
MAGIPPQINTDPGTPAREWAQSTTTAAFARTEPAPALPGSNNANVEPTTGGVSIGAAGDAQKGAAAFAPAPTSSDGAQKGPFDPSFTQGGVPGAYPVTPGDHDPTRQMSASETAQAAVEQASTFVQSAANTAAQYIPQSVKDTVSSYMPTSSATATMSTARASEHDIEHTTSFPTKELSGAGNRERVGGVGSLPGPVNESAVPKLPEERHNDERYITAAGAAATVAGGAYALKDRVMGSVPSQDQARQTAQETAENVKQTAQSTAQNVKQSVPGMQSHSTAVAPSTLPAHEPFGARPGEFSSGAGALPGHQSEANVALLPEESAHPQFDSGAVATHAQAGLKPSEEPHGNEASTGAMRHVAGVGALVGDRSEEGVARLPDERSSTDVSKVGSAKSNAGVGAVVGGRDDTGKQSVKGVSASDKPPAPPAKDGESEKKATPAVTGHKGAPNKLPGDPGTGRFTSESPEDFQSHDTRTDLLNANPKPRAHALGGDRSQWGNVPMNGSAARKDRDYDGSGYDTNYHPAEMHPLQEGSKDPSEHAAEGEKSLGATQADASRPSEEQRPPHSGDASSGQQQKQHKVGFMEKMKGEAKVLIGKVERKQEKVEEGQRIKTGEAKPTQA